MTKYSSQYIDNLSFDDGLKVKVVEIVNPDGSLPSLATSDKQDTGNTILQSIAGFNIPKFDEIAVTYPTTSSEVYTYKLASATVGTLTVTYSDAVTKQIITNVKLT